MSLIDTVAISRAAKHRLKIILRLRQQGKTLEEIGHELSITRQRVSQILQREERKKSPA